jgi:hypothetical protein
MRPCAMPFLPSILGCVSEEELHNLLEALRTWVKDKHGRQKELASAMQVNEHTVSHWLAGRKRPSLKKYFELREFLRSHRRK